MSGAKDRGYELSRGALVGGVEKVAKRIKNRKTVSGTYSQPEQVGPHSRDQIRHEAMRQMEKMQAKPLKKAPLKKIPKETFSNFHKQKPKGRATGMDGNGQPVDYSKRTPGTITSWD